MQRPALRHLAHMLEPFARLEWGLLAGLALAAAAFWGFMELADEVLEGGTRAVDRALLLAFRNAEDPSDPWGPRWLHEVMRDFTALGGMALLTLFTAAAIGYLLLDAKRHAAVAVFVAVAGGQLLSILLKIGFDRPRPDLVPHDIFVYTASFPSGHSMMSAVTYLTLGAMLARVDDKLAHKIYVLGLALLLTVVVGVSRIYLGVHWPSDVVGGWAVGAGWALLCWSVMRHLQRRGQIERSND
ncbi:MAG: Membrane-associated phospholipid phosphatase [Burkholderiales bacterium]|nr:Membrane-associated phospholipid phosphatase [Burkholderiales bacterium]